MCVLMLIRCAATVDIFNPRPTNIPVGDFSPVIEYTDRLIRRHMSILDIPSVVVSLIDDQRVIWHQAHGVADLANREAATLDTVYKLGSIAKLFTGLEIMRMVEEGLVDLDSPIKTYVPEFSIRGRWHDRGPITIRSILSHRSGLPRNGALLSWYWDSIPQVLEAQTSTLGELYQAYPVGYRYKYSNIGYNILGRIIEVVRGIEPPAESAPGAFPYYMEAELLIPLGMFDSGFGSRSLLYGAPGARSIAQGYYREGGRNHPYNQFDIIRFASGGLHSTMRDMEEFAHFIFSEGESVERHIISRNILKKMFEVQYARPEDPQTTGLTWFTDTVQLQELVVFHSGTNQGTISLIALMPERKLGIVLFANSDVFEEIHNQLAFDVLELMLEVKYGIRPSKTPKASRVEIIDEAALQALTGRYIANGEVFEVVKSSGGIRVQYRGLTFGMVPTSATSFLLEQPLVGSVDMSVSFFPADSVSRKSAIVTLGGSYHITCPEYPRVDEIPPLWREVVGKYRVLSRYPSIYSDSDAFGTMEILVDDGVLRTSDGKVLWSLNEGELVIVGGIFDGEIMELDLSAQTITWQNIVLKRID